LGKIPQNLLLLHLIIVKLNKIKECVLFDYLKIALLFAFDGIRKQIAKVTVTETPAHRRSLLAQYW